MWWLESESDCEIVDVRVADAVCDGDAVMESNDAVSLLVAESVREGEFEMLTS